MEILLTVYGNSTDQVDISQRKLKYRLRVLSFFFAGICSIVSFHAHADKIYAIGDSVTNGRNFNFDAQDFPLSAYRLNAGSPPDNIRSYREHLHDRLTAGGSCDASIEWVGSTGQSDRVPAFHEGRSGWRVDEFNDRQWTAINGGESSFSIDGWLGEFQPDHVLIHLGTNDMLEGKTAENTIDDLEILLDTVKVETPEASVFLANVIPVYGWWANHLNVAPDYSPADTALEASQLTNLIEVLVAERQSSGDDIHLVDVNSDFFVDTSDVTNCATGAPGNPLNMSTSDCKLLPDGSGEEPDGVHPNALGDKFIADKFFEMLSTHTSLCSGAALDNVAPTVVITTPSSPGGELSSVATLQGTASDTGNLGFNGVDVSVVNATGNYLNFATGLFSDAESSSAASLSNTDPDSTDWSITTPGLPDGAYSVKVSATDASGNTSFDVSRWFVVNETDVEEPPVVSGSLFMEAESGVLAGAMAVTAEAEASSGNYISVALGSASPDSAADYVDFMVSIETAGEYEIQGRVRGPSGRSNSFFAQIDGGQQYLWDTPKDNVWTTDVISNRGSGDVTVNLDAGVHTLRVGLREMGTQLDYIEFVLLNASDISEDDDPVDEGDTLPPSVTIASPATNGETLPSVVTLSGSASDAGGAGFDRVFVSVRNSADLWLNFSTGEFSETVGYIDASLSNMGLDATSWSATTPALADGSYSAQVSAVDLAGNISGVALRTFVVGGGTDQDDDDLQSPTTALFQEAENAVLAGAMTVATDSLASNGSFVSVPSGGQSSDTSGDYVEFSINIEVSGTYRVLAGVKGLSGRQNSFFVQVDEGTQHIWDLPADNVLTDVFVSDRSTGTLSFTLDAGVHTFRATFREVDAQLDFIEFLLQSNT